MTGGGDGDDPGAARRTPVLKAGSPELDIERARELRRMKIVAFGFLAVAAILYICAEWALRSGAGEWAGYLRAAAEAGMVGGIADWFAVTALFRHPFGIPIPHTALIPRKKDQLGGSLGDFVGENFLDPDLVSEKVRSARIPERAGQWLQDDEHRAMASDQTGKAVRAVLRVLRDDDATAIVERTLIARLTEPPWGPPAGRILAELLEEKRHEPLLDLLADKAHEWVRANPETIELWIKEKAPTWAPNLVNELLSDRAYRELDEWTWQVKVNRAHPVREALIKFARDFAWDLQNDPETMHKLESFKHEVLGRKEVRRAATTAWQSAKRIIIDSTYDESSELRAKIDELLSRVADMLVEDDSIRTRFDEYTTRTAKYVAEHYSGEVSSIISDTVQRWDGKEAASKIELHAGKNLQFIRINGTVVAALAGLVIHFLTHVVF